MPEFPDNYCSCDNCRWYQNIELSGSWGCANPDFNPDPAEPVYDCQLMLWEPEEGDTDGLSGDIHQG